MRTVLCLENAKILACARMSEDIKHSTVESLDFYIGFYVARIIPRDNETFTTQEYERYKNMVITKYYNSVPFFKKNTPTRSHG